MLMTRLVPILLFVLVLVQVNSSEASPKCIDPSEIQKRASVFIGCTPPNVFHYIWSSADGKYKEGCYESKMVPKGHMTVINKQSNHVEYVECPEETFQPTEYLSNTKCNCSFIKSKCDTIGSIVVSNGSTYGDRSCGCDKKRGFDFIHTPKKNGYCEPINENCTCYLVKLHDDKDENSFNTTIWIAIICIIGFFFFQTRNRNTTKIYIWDAKYTDVGHGSMKLKDDTYISFWPKEDKRRRLRLTSVTSLTTSTYDEDVELKGRPADCMIIIPAMKLDTQKIKAWWNHVKDTKKYHVFGNNCCSVVYEALRRGGAERYKSFPWILVSTPANLKKYALDLKSA